MGQSLDFPHSPGSTSGKEPACQRRKRKRRRFDPWVTKIPWRRKGQPTRYSCLGNPLNRGAWWAIVHGVAKSWTAERQSTHTAKYLIYTEKYNKISCLHHRIQENHAGTCVLQVSAIIIAPVHTWIVLCNFPSAITF